MEVGSNLKAHIIYMFFELPSCKSSSYDIQKKKNIYIEAHKIY